MGSRISQGLAAFVLSVALAAAQISAQTGGGLSPDVPLSQAGPPVDGSHAGPPTQPEAKPSPGSAVVSVDVLRHPITAKVRQRLASAMERMESGDHETAIGQLLETLAKYPDSAPYVHNLLGVEYVKTDRFTDAVTSLQKAVVLLPHDAMTHYNLGLALICTRDYDRAEQQVRLAVDLDPKNTRMQARLKALVDFLGNRGSLQTARIPDQKR